MKTLLKEAVIWVAVGTLAILLNAMQASGETRFVFPEISGQKSVIKVWVRVNALTFAGSVEIFCSIPGPRESESTCVTANEEIFVEKGDGGSTYTIAKDRVLSKGPSVAAASRIAADAINRILFNGQIQGKIPFPREFLRPKALPVRSIPPEEI